jgi:hypothetical protein
MIEILESQRGTITKVTARRSRSHKGRGVGVPACGRIGEPEDSLEEEDLHRRPQRSQRGLGNTSGPSFHAPWSFQQAPKGALATSR